MHSLVVNVARGWKTMPDARIPTRSRDSVFIAVRTRAYASCNLAECNSDVSHHSLEPESSYQLTLFTSFNSFFIFTLTAILGRVPIIVLMSIR